MFLVLQTANVTADARNCLYPNRKEIRTGDDLKEAVRFDHVCGEFKKNYRNIENIGEAKLLTREYGEELRYSDATDFLRYDGDAWIEDRQLAVGAIQQMMISSLKISLQRPKNSVWTLPARGAKKIFQSL